MLCSLRMSILYFSAAIQLTTQVCFLLPEPLPWSFLSNYGDLYLCNLEEMSFQHGNLHCGVWKSCISLAVWSLENSTLTFIWSVIIIGYCWSSKLGMWIFYEGHFAPSKERIIGFWKPWVKSCSQCQSSKHKWKGLWEELQRFHSKLCNVAWNESIWKKKKSRRLSLLILSKSANLTLGWPGKPQ